MSIIDNNAGGAGADEDCDTSTSSADMFKHVIGQCDLSLVARVRECVRNLDQRVQKVMS